MLTKLLKHEFRATARIMGPLYLVLLAVALGFNFSARLMDSGNFVLNMLAALVVMAYVVAITAVFIVAFILMLQRFYKNLLGDEGYIMFTLPASVHQHVWSKLIVSSVWFIITGVVVMLSFVMMALDVSFLEGMVQALQQLFQDITAYYAINGTVLLLELLVLITVNLGIFNLLPFPALDGGKVVFLLIEGVTGHAVPEKIQSGLTVAAFALLFGLMIFATYNDILRLITGAM